MVEAPAVASAVLVLAVAEAAASIASVERKSEETVALWVKFLVNGTNRPFSRNPCYISLISHYISYVM